MNQLHLPTAVGNLVLTLNSAGRAMHLDWLEPLSTDSALSRSACSWANDPCLPARAARLMGCLQNYFETGQPLDPEWVFTECLDGSGWTEFKRAVYATVIRIPHGETRTYAWVAQKIGRPGASRAVGQALRRNNQLILIPCHRVVASQDLGGFMGQQDPSAPEVLFKKRLLGWENSWLNPSFGFFDQSA